MNPDPAIRPARYAYGVWLVLTLLGAWAYHSLTPFSLRAANQVVGEFGSLPGGYRLYLNLQPWLWIAPACFLTLLIICNRFVLLRHPVTISVFGGIISGLYFGMGILLASPYFMYAGLPPFPERLQTQLRQADEISVLALWTIPGGPVPSAKFHNYPLLAKVNLTTHPRRQEIVEGLIEGSQTNSTEMMCFYPHHGVSLVHKGKTIDLLVCFGCGKALNQNTGEYYRMSKSAQPVLDSFLEEAGIRLPPAPKQKPSGREEQEKEPRP